MALPTRFSLADKIKGLRISCNKSVFSFFLLVLKLVISSSFKVNYFFKMPLMCNFVFMSENGEQRAV